MASYLDICTRVLASGSSGQSESRGLHNQTFTQLKPVLTQEEKLIRLWSNLVQQQNINITFLLFIWKKKNLI